MYARPRIAFNLCVIIGHSKPSEIGVTNNFVGYHVRASLLLSDVAVAAAAAAAGGLLLRTAALSVGGAISRMVVGGEGGASLILLFGLGGT